MWMFREPLEKILIGLAVRLFIVAVIFPLHEMAHGLVANWLGDPTAKRMGRLTLNPLVHMDIFGTLCIFLLGFGWAKGVPVNPNNFKNRKAGMALTALAGPVSNIIAAFIGMILFHIFSPGLVHNGAIHYMFYVYITVNLSLAVFNLFPIPPLDGSKILAVLIPDRFMETFYQYERYFFIVLIMVVFSGVLDVPIYFLVDLLETGLSWAASGIVGIFR